MKGTIEGKALYEAMRSVQGVAATKATLPVLQGVKLTMSPGSLELHATDLEQSVLLTVPAEVEKAGGVVIPAARFAQICKALSDNPIALEADETFSTVVKGKGGRFKLPGYSQDDFPVMVEIEKAVPLAFVGTSLAMGLKRVVWCVSPDTSRYNLTGVRLMVLEGQVSLAATDGHRLAELKVPIEGKTESVGLRAIIPSEAVKKMIELLDGHGEVKLMVADSSIGLDVDGTRFVTRLIEGTFPNVDQVTPMDQPNRYTVPVAEMQDALRKVLLVSTERQHTTKFTFEPENPVLVSSRDIDAGEVDVQVHASAWSGAAVTIGFNAKFILDALAQVPAGSVEFRMKDGLGPLVMLAEGAPVVVVMPLRI